MTRVVGLQRILRSEVVLQHPLKRRTRESRGHKQRWSSRWPPLKLQTTLDVIIAPF